ncbi:MAG: alpha/beta fold hydrolase [Caulobacterales bacterium]|nr:alpha/beta fold hydrolase [Caulobacterales bacterium]
MLLAVLSAVLAVQAAPGPQDVTLPGAPAPLAGTLIDAGSGAPAALIIAGSGPTDRDGNSPLGVTASTYRLLAEGLAAEGITTLRYDKRGVAASAGAAVAESELRFDTMVEDARAWAGLLRERTDLDCVWLIGHSEGALVASAVAATDATGLCGLVLLSGAGRPAAVVLREQLRAGTPEPYLGQALTVIDELDAGRTVDCPPILAALCRSSVQPYVISWFDQDPAALLAAHDLPTLVMHGTTDFQTLVTDAEALAAARPEIELIVLEGVNHLLKEAPADRMTNLATYSNPDLPLAPGVLSGIAGFIRRSAETGTH